MGGVAEGVKTIFGGGPSIPDPPDPPKPTPQAPEKKKKPLKTKESRTSTANKKKRGVRSLTIPLGGTGGEQSQSGLGIPKG